MTTSRVTAVKRMITQVEPGVSVSDTLRDSAIIALQSNVTVVVSHKHAQYVINPTEILRLIVSQSPLVTGSHRIEKTT